MATQGINAASFFETTDPISFIPKDSDKPSETKAINTDKGHRRDYFFAKNPKEGLEDGLDGLIGLTSFSYPLYLLDKELASRGIAALASNAARGATALLGIKAAVVVCSFGLGLVVGMGINYIPTAMGGKKTIGDYLGDSATDVFGPADRHGTFFKVGEYLGLA